MYNLAILGGGPAGYTAAEKACKAGWSVVLFEKESLGGTCLNVGCIPTKTLLYSAKQYVNARQADKYGVQVDGVTFDYSKIHLRKQKVVRKLVAGVKARMQGVDVIAQEARVVERTDAHIIIEAGDDAIRYEAERLLICTGSTNFVPPIPGILDNPHIWDSTDALASKELPDSIAIIGGGIIGMEFATLYMELGVPVTVIEAMPSILPNIDSEIVSILRQRYEKQGVKILTSTCVQSVEDNHVVYSCPETQTAGSVEADKILVCVGRRPCMAGLETLSDLQLDRRGIKVNDAMQTNFPNVYAAGDVTGQIMLAHFASRQAEIAVEHMLHPDSKTHLDLNAVPSVVYTNPEIASVGLSEQQAVSFFSKKDGCPESEAITRIEVHRLPMTFSGRFVAENEGENGFCKMIVDKELHTVLGVQMYGNPCSEFIAAAGMAIRMGYTLPQMHEFVFPHPTVSEILHELL